MISAIGKSGARSSGPSGFSVPGCSTGGSGFGRSACRLYQNFGILDSSRTYLTVSFMLPPCAPEPSLRGGSGGGKASLARAARPRPPPRAPPSTRIDRDQVPRFAEMRTVGLSSRTASCSAWPSGDIMVGPHHRTRPRTEADDESQRLHPQRNRHLRGHRGPLPGQWPGAAQACGADRARRLREDDGPVRRRGRARSIFWESGASAAGTFSSSRISTAPTSRRAPRTKPRWPRCWGSSRPSAPAR